MNTEDKLAWCDAYGQDAERSFCVTRLFDLSIPAWLNTDKKSNPYTHDLFCAFPSDLKTVRTPLFKAQELYGIDPQYAITFNEKDGKRYRELYPNIVVVFDVQWTQTSMEIGGKTYEVEPMHITVAGFLDDISAAVRKSGSQRIEYQRRKGDTSGNAKASWVLDARNLHRLKA